MNAYELADTLQETEPYYSTDYKLFDNAAAMLRQQQAEIESLKKAAKQLRDFCDDWSGVDNNQKRFSEVVEHNNALDKLERLL